MAIELSKESQLLLEIQRLSNVISGGLTRRNIKEYRNTYVINIQDSLDATYPTLIPFNILSDMTNMVSVKVSFWILPYRAYPAAGIYQETNSPSIRFSVSRDNGLTYGNIVGTYTESKSNIEITSLVDTIGSKIIKFESTVRARIAVQVEIKLDVLK